MWRAVFCFEAPGGMPFILEFLFYKGGKFSDVALQDVSATCFDVSGLFWFFAIKWHLLTAVSQNSSDTGQLGHLTSGCFNEIFSLNSSSLSLYWRRWGRGGNREIKSSASSLGTKQPLTKYRRKGFDRLMGYLDATKMVTNRAISLRTVLLCFLQLYRRVQAALEAQICLLYRRSSEDIAMIIAISQSIVLTQMVTLPINNRPSQQ